MLGLHTLTLLQQAGESGSPIALVLTLGLFLLFLAGAWKVYSKAGHPGWVMFVPIYNAYVLLKIVGRPGWWLLLFFIPLVNAIIGIVLCFDLAKSYGKGALFGLGLLFLGPIFYMILGLGSAQYEGPAAA